MKRAILFSVAAAAMVAAPAFANDKFDVREDLPMQIHNFRLPDLDGNMHQLTEWSDAKAMVLFIQGNGCPIVRQTFPYLKEIRDEFEPKGVQFVMINSNAIDDPASIQEELKEYEVDILTLKDTLQAVARYLESERTAEMFVIDPETWTIIYRGEADDRFGYGLQRSNPQEFYLKDALDGWLADKSMPETRKRITKGCLMDLIDLPEKVDFKADVKPILQSLCSTCSHDDPKKCVSAWNVNQAEMHTAMLWDMLLMQQKPAVACCEAGAELDLEREDAVKLMAWLRSHDPRVWEDMAPEAELPISDENL